MCIPKDNTVTPSSLVAPSSLVCRRVCHVTSRVESLTPMRVCACAMYNLRMPPHQTSIVCHAILSTKRPAPLQRHATVLAAATASAGAHSRRVFFCPERASSHWMLGSGFASVLSCAASLLTCVRSKQREPIAMSPAANERMKITTNTTMSQ